MHATYPLVNPGPLLSPSLLIYRDLVRANLDAMIATAGGPLRLRPHVKTHKMPALVHLAEHAGVHKHKCATIAEAEMIAEAGARDVLIAYPIVGPNLGRLARLVESFPETTFRVTVDDPDAARALSDALSDAGRPVSTLVDLDVGMGRTGIAPGPEAEALYALVASLPNLEPGGLHAYDGHVQIADVAERQWAVRAGQEPVLAMRDRLAARGLPVPRLVLGGTPSFPVHAGLDGNEVELSPGTCLLHDDGYAAKFTDMDYTPAAVLLTRVISRPRPGRFCLDLGHKAVAADPSGPRVRLLDLPEATFVTHSEEHLVVETPRAAEFPVGTALLAIPTHICPTCALHRRAYVIEGGELVDEWEVAARDRVIGV
jgi:D-serine deaminase-like pyridoxal phosphate-dependent protein